MSTAGLEPATTASERPKMDHGAIRCKIDRFMGIAEILIPGIGVSGNEFLVL